PPSSLTSIAGPVTLSTIFFRQEWEVGRAGMNFPEYSTRSASSISPAFCLMEAHAYSRRERLHDLDGLHADADDLADEVNDVFRMIRAVRVRSHAGPGIL